MNAIVPVAAPHMGVADMMQLARAIAQSGLFGMKTPDQALALMSIAQAEGRHPALAARDYDIIQGRPAKKAEAMMRDFIQAGGKVEWHALTDERADATFTHPQTGSVRIDWDLKRAATAGVAGKDNWKKFPRSMLRSRVVSEGVRTIWPLATSGMYVPEEVSDFTGKTIDGAAETPPDLHQAVNTEAPLKAVAANAPRGERITDKATVYEKEPVKPSTGNGQKRDIAPADQEWLDHWQTSFDAALTTATVRELEASTPFANSIRRAPPFLVERLREIVYYAYQRVVPKTSDPTAQASDEPSDEVAIEGEKYAAA